MITWKRPELGSLAGLLDGAGELEARLLTTSSLPGFSAVSVFAALARAPPRHAQGSAGSSRAPPPLSYDQVPSVRLFELPHIGTRYSCLFCYSGVHR